MLSGWDQFNADDTKLLKGMGLSFHQDLIIVEKGSKPTYPLWNLTYLIAGVLGFVLFFGRTYLKARGQELSG